MEQLRAKILADVGLHARPAALFVGVAKKHASKVRVRNATTEGKWVDAKSILGVLTLGVEQDHEIEVTAEGPDEAQVIAALGALIKANFVQG